MANHRHKLSYAVALAVERIVRVGMCPTFDTFTFQENVTNKDEAARCWRNLKARLARHYPGLEGVGVWQRQRRGAWHLHYVFDRRLDVVQVRAWAVECGFGPQLNMRAVSEQPGMKAGWTGARVAKYLTRYITRDLSELSDPGGEADDDEGDKGVRIVDYLGAARVGTVNFRWVGGFAFLWRAGRQAWADLFNLFPDSYAVTPSNRDTGFLLQAGWHSLDDVRRMILMAQSEAVCRWANPENYPF